jgi:Recombination endonuclease VII
MPREARPVIAFCLDRGFGKICSRCRQWVSIHGFGRLSCAPDGHRSACVDCEVWGRFLRRDQHKAYARSYRRTTEGEAVSRDLDYYKKYGISLEIYEQILAEQDGKCAICREPPSMIRFGRVVPLEVDHDHDTGAVRGLLCYRCNTCLERVESVAGWIKSSVAYLARQADHRSRAPERLTASRDPRKLT